MTTPTPAPGSRRTPLSVKVDHAHGGRWTSLSTTDREWLWHRPTSDRHLVWPGHPFVDAGGLEECVPTVRGVPDHGDAWSRPWRQTDGDRWSASCPEFEVSRALSAVAGSVVADYTLTAQPGYRFVWAAHALLDLGPTASLNAPAGTPTWVYQHVGRRPRGLGATGPGGSPATSAARPGPRTLATALRHPGAGPWPAPHGTRLNCLGPDDGTALGAILVGCATTVVTDGLDALAMTLDCPGQPVSTALWRNLRGWPDENPYRSVGVEPMLGAVFDLADAGPDDAATVPASGAVSWRLTLTAYTTREEPR